MNNLKDEIAKAIRDNAEKPDKSIFYRLIALTVFTTLCAVLFLYFGTSLFSSSPETKPFGEIITPTPGTTTGCTVRVVGKTANLEPGQHAWLAVDKPSLHLCWPKGELPQNINFATTIFEEGPKEGYALSLYIVNKTVNDQWAEWLKAQRHGGLPMPPDNKRLDSVRLILGE